MKTLIINKAKSYLVFFNSLFFIIYSGIASDNNLHSLYEKNHNDFKNTYGIFLDLQAVINKNNPRAIGLIKPSYNTDLVQGGTAVSLGFSYPLVYNLYKKSTFFVNSAYNYYIINSEQSIKDDDFISHYVAGDLLQVNEIKSYFRFRAHAVSLEFIYNYDLTEQVNVDKIDPLIGFSIGTGIKYFITNNEKEELQLSLKKNANNQFNDSIRPIRFDDKRQTAVLFDGSFNEFIKFQPYLKFTLSEKWIYRTTTWNILLSYSLFFRSLESKYNWKINEMTVGLHFFYSF
ncbi:MAG: hypothetical protein NT007_01590 [Candidatus Kapabacteria bacterium]|nr:hypothetical protein [Candidatus Kapabacteria bacterium]